MFSKNKNGCFDCDKCPMNSDPAKGRFCVMWWELVISNANGESKVEKSCGFRLLPAVLVETLKSADHSAAAAYDMRNQVTSSVDKFLNTAGTLLQHQAQAAIEHKGEDDETE